MPSYRLAVLGDPISHSRSPEIHTAMLELAGLDGSYERISADRDTLSTVVVGLRAGEWQGLNITMPLKSAAADMADRLSPQAERSHSVNTLLVEGGQVWGHSTDSTTFRALITDDRFVGASAVLLLGAGGSAKAALATIDTDRPVYIAARRSERAQRVAEVFGADVVAWGASVAGALVINTTPLGMEGETLPGDVVEASAGLIDLPYSSKTTPSVLTATTLGLPTVDGHEFLIRQAMAAFRLWTGVSVDYDQLHARLRNA